MYYVCQLGQLIPRAQFVRYVSMNYWQLGQLVPSAQLARYVLFMPIGPIVSTGLIRAISPNELMPIGPIGSIGPIGAIRPIVANWANWFHGPNWRDMYYEWQLGQLVPRAQLVRYVSRNYYHLGQLVPSAQLARYVLFMPIGPIGSTVPIGATCPNELMPIGPIGSIGPIGRYFVLSPIGPIGTTGPIGAICTNELMPIGPIGSIGPIGAKCAIDANWANWFHMPNWCDMSQ